MSTLGKVFLQGLKEYDQPLVLQTDVQVIGLHKGEHGLGWNALLENSQVHSCRALVLNKAAPQALKLADEFLNLEVRTALQAVH